MSSKLARSKPRLSIKDMHLCYSGLKRPHSVCDLIVPSKPYNALSLQPHAQSWRFAKPVVRVSC